MIKNVTFEKTDYNDLPLKFEAGTPMIAEVLGLGTAIDYLTSVGMENIQAWEHDLLQYGAKQIKQIEGLRIIGTAEKKGGIISFIIEGVHSLDIGTLLDFQGIAVRTGHHCTQPAMKRFGISGTTRMSFALYNTRKEIDYLVKILPKIIHQLK